MSANLRMLDSRVKVDSMEGVIANARAPAVARVDGRDIDKTNMKKIMTPEFYGTTLNTIPYGVDHVWNLPTK